MASDLQLKRAPFPQEEEEEFQQILKQIGGKGNVYLVGDVNREDGECKCSLMKEFVADVLPVDDLHREINSNGGVKSDCCPGQDGQQRKPEVGASIRAKSDKGRAMRCALVIFIFRHSYVHEKANHVCVKEVLKDVKARTVGHGAWPGLLGLVHAHSESPETRESVELLEQMLRSVFRKHPHDSIWAGHFVPKALEGVQAIRRHVCKAVLSAQATDNAPVQKGHLFLSVRQWFRRGRRDRANNSSNCQVHRGNTESTEEGIPLQKRAEPRVLEPGY
ncbi:uncharacterized protein LOC103040691 isoform X1 [Astyanax mexicanus]|uniref:uncharacterized protein LOC103040691 isoform X1 n=1 Tax=Astyanax mexicanus TaxID=7994 RepID=UPI0020CB017D|nr:uncharacterized protein LOC103040691 isoform X1 [Astyanax mexicanus]